MTVTDQFASAAAALIGVVDVMSDLHTRQGIIDGLSPGLLLGVCGNLERFLVFRLRGVFGIGGLGFTLVEKLRLIPVDFARAAELAIEGNAEFFKQLFVSRLKAVNVGENIFIESLARFGCQLHNR